MSVEPTIPLTDDANEPSMRPVPLGPAPTASLEDDRPLPRASGSRHGGRRDVRADAARAG